MYVVCIFPIAGNVENTKAIMEAYKEKILPQLRALGVKEPQISFPQSDYVFVATDKVLVGQPKGKGIIEVIKNTRTTPDYIIVCDGSGAIPYDKTVEVFRLLISDSTTNCVMANRVGRKAISNIRVIIERWEVFLLKEFFQHPQDIPDGQAGLWGFGAKKIYFDGVEKKIALTAEGYDIELDLLSEVLAKKIGYAFISVELPERPSPSNFLYENNLDKMKFLLRKHDGLKDILPVHLKKFEQEKSKELSELSNQEKETWENYKKDLLNI